MSDDAVSSLGDLAVLGEEVGREVSARAERLMRAQTVANRIGDVRAKAAELLKEVEAIRVAWDSEKGSAGNVPLAAP